jgi:hypothetical protein
MKNLAQVVAALLIVYSIPYAIGFFEVSVGSGIINLIFTIPAVFVSVMYLKKQ